MKNIFLIFFIALGLSGFAQKVTHAKKSSVIIGTKKVRMKTKGNLMHDSLLLPVVSNRYPQLKNALCEDSLLWGQKLKDVVQQYKKDGTGITSLSYEVTYQDRRVISIILHYETMAAYPDSYQKFMTLDIATGKSHLIANEITPIGITAIFTNYKKELYKQITATAKDFATDKELSKEDSQDIVRTLKTSVDSLKQGDIFSQYLFTKNGITVKSEDALNHAVHCYEIVRDLPVSHRLLHAYKAPAATVIK